MKFGKWYLKLNRVLVPNKKNLDIWENYILPGLESGARSQESFPSLLQFPIHRFALQHRLHGHHHYHHHHHLLYNHQQRHHHCQPYTWSHLPNNINLNLFKRSRRFKTKQIESEPVSAQFQHLHCYIHNSDNLLLVFSCCLYLPCSKQTSYVGRKRVWWIEGGPEGDLTCIPSNANNISCFLFLFKDSLSPLFHFRVANNHHQAE